MGHPWDRDPPPQPPAEPAARPVRRARRRARRARPRAARGVVLCRPRAASPARGPECWSATSSRPQSPWRRRCGRTDGRTASERWPPWRSAGARRRPDAGAGSSDAAGPGGTGAGPRRRCRAAPAPSRPPPPGPPRRGVGAGDGQGPLGPPGGGGETARPPGPAPAARAVVDGRAEGVGEGPVGREVEAVERDRARPRPPVHAGVVAGDGRNAGHGWPGDVRSGHVQADQASAGRRTGPAHQPRRVGQRDRHPVLGHGDQRAFDTDSGTENSSCGLSAPRRRPG